jgi:hypothetical protein
LLQFAAVEHQRLVVWLVCLMSLTGVSHARAQSDSRFAIGGEFAVKMSDRASKEDSARGQLGPGLLWRFGAPKPGWGFHWGLNWYAVDVDRPIGGLGTELGELHIRPFMAGYGYTQIIRKYAITADVLGGYAFGSIGVSPTAIDAYRSRLGAQSVSGNASNTLVLKPEIGVWYDLNKKVGINANAGYMFARPDVTISSSLGSETRKARADQFILKVGVVYSIF